jgi:hypothetical protein
MTRGILNPTDSRAHRDAMEKPLASGPGKQGEINVI